MPLLQVAEAEVRFGGVHALRGVHLTVDAGSVTGLIGPNGAGKTTCFNAICGLQSINAGRMTFDGADMTGLKPHKRARLGIARTFQRLEIFGSLSVRENVLAAAEIRRRWSHDRSDAGANADAVLHLVGLSQLATSAADTLPTGQARLLELARALATQPRLLLLDEPSSGLSDTESEELGDLLCRLAEAGMGVLLVEHDMGLVMRVCTDINVLDFGAVLMAGSPAEIRADERVRAAYLGAADDPEEDSHETDVALAGVGPSASASSSSASSASSSAAAASAAGVAHG